MKADIIEFIKTSVFNSIIWKRDTRQMIIDKYGDTQHRFLTKRIPAFLKYEKVIFYVGKASRGHLQGIQINLIQPPVESHHLTLDYGWIQAGLDYEKTKANLLSDNIKFLEVTGTEKPYKKLITQSQVTLLFESSADSLSGDSLTQIYRYASSEVEAHFLKLAVG